MFDYCHLEVHMLLGNISLSVIRNLDWKFCFWKQTQRKILLLEMWISFEIKSFKDFFVRPIWDYEQEVYTSLVCVYYMFSMILGILNLVSTCKLMNLKEDVLLQVFCFAWLYYAIIEHHYLLLSKRVFCFLLCEIYC